MDASRYSLAAIVWGTYIAMHFTDGLQYSNGSMDGDPNALGLIIVAAIVIFSWPRLKLPIVPEVPVGRLRRYVAATIDILSLCYVCFAIIFPLTYLMEWMATGSWQWSWQRETFEPQDIIGVLTFVLAFYGMYQYFWRHLLSGKPTVGQFVMGYRIIALEDAKFRQRLHSGMIATWLWPFALMKTYDKAGITYWDKDTNTRAVSTRAP